MAELVDALDSKSSFRKEVGVRFPLPAPINSNKYRDLRGSLLFRNFAQLRDHLPRIERASKILPTSS